jgi:hypothetical protein
MQYEFAMRASVLTSWQNYFRKVCQVFLFFAPKEMANVALDRMEKNINISK